MLAGSLDRRVAIFRRPARDDGFSFVPGEPQEVGRRWMERSEVSDGERIRAAAQGESITARFTARYDSLTKTIGGTDRLICEGVTYEVTGRKEIGFREGVEITAKAISA